MTALNYALIAACISTMLILILHAFAYILGV